MIDNSLGCEPGVRWYIHVEGMGYYRSCPGGVNVEFSQTLGDAWGYCSKVCAKAMLFFVLRLYPSAVLIRREIARR